MMNYLVQPGQTDRPADCHLTDWS